MSSPQGTFNTYIAGALALSPGSGAVPIVVALIFIMHTWMGIMVGQARRRFGVPYPTLYAVPGTLRNYAPVKDKSEAGGSGGSATAASALTGGSAHAELIGNEDAYHFNCVQRGHQNTVENLPAVIAMLLVCWLTFPAYAAGCGAIWIVGRVLYMRVPRSRLSSAAALAQFPYRADYPLRAPHPRRLGYMRGTETRLWGAVGYIGLLGLLALTIASGVFLFQQKAAY
jgi:glutathione S-transferase